MSFSLSPDLDEKKVFLTDFTALEKRWDPNYYRYMREFRSRVESCPFPMEKLKSALSLVQYGISERATAEPVGVPMLRMLNLQEDSWDFSDLKYIDLDEDGRKLYGLEPGDILFNRTNSKELVGKCAVFDSTDEYVFASYLIRVRLKPNTYLPDYVVAYLSSSLGRLQIDAVSRQIAGMTNVNAEEIRNLEIPVLDWETQENIVKLWQAAIRHRDETVLEAKTLLGSIDDLMLHELGIEKLSAPSNTVHNRMFQRNFLEVTSGRFDPSAHQERRHHLIQSIDSSKFPVKQLRSLIGFSKDIVTGITENEIYVGLENIDGATGEYMWKSERESIGSALRFEPGQILFPKLRPYLNKTFLADFSGICSTEFHVFNPDGIRADYLTEFLRSSPIVEINSMLMTGNTLPRLQVSDILQIPVVVPPVSMQESIVDRIAGIRGQSSRLREKARADLEAAKRKIEAIILGEERT